MKIIYYSPHPTHDTRSEVGYSTHQRETIAAFRSLGHEVLEVNMGNRAIDSGIYSLQNASEEKSNNNWKQKIKKYVPHFIWNVLKILLLRRHDHRAKKALLNAVKSFNPDLIYERSEYLQDSGIEVAQKQNIQHFLELNAPLVEEMKAFEGPSWLDFWGHAIERKKIQKTHQLLVVSSALEKFVKKEYGFKGNALIIPNCVNQWRKKPDINSITEVRNQLKSHYQFVVGFVGSLFPYHGVDILIDAFSMALKQSPDMKLVIVGDGAIKSDLEALANTVIPKENYVFTGKIAHQDVMKYIGAFDVAVMANSNWYGSPIKIFEYGFMSRPIIAPNVAPVRDVMEHLKDGFLVAPEKVALAEAILRMRYNEAEGREMAMHFYAKIMDQYTWTKQAQRVLDLAALGQ